MDFLKISPTYLRELHPDHKRIDAWIRSFQQTLRGRYQVQAKASMAHFAGVIIRHLLQNLTAPKKKPAKKTSWKIPSASPKMFARKKPSASSFVLKRPGANKNHIKFAVRLVSSLMTRRTSTNASAVLSLMPVVHKEIKCSCGEQCYSELHGHLKTYVVFRVLEHPNDALDRKPLAPWS